MSSEGSVTTWIGLLEIGEEEAAQALWDRYFPRLIALARAKLRGASLQVADEEDVALSAFHAFFQAAARRKIPRLSSRDDLWRTLVLITAGKAIDQRRRQSSRKRGGAPPVGESAPTRLDIVALEEVVGTEPDPLFAAQIAEEFRLLLARLADEPLREIALYKLEGYSNEEIAARLQCTERTVTRRLTLIRRTWEAPPGA